MLHQLWPCKATGPTTLPLRSQPDIKPPHQLRKNKLNLVAGEEAPRARVRPSPKRQAVSVERYELMLVLFPSNGPDVAVSPWVEFGERWRFVRLERARGCVRAGEERRSKADAGPMWKVVTGRESNAAFSDDITAHADCCFD